MSARPLLCGCTIERLCYEHAPSAPLKAILLAPYRDAVASHDWTPTARKRAARTYADAAAARVSCTCSRSWDWSRMGTFLTSEHEPACGSAQAWVKAYDYRFAELEEAAR